MRGMQLVYHLVQAGFVAVVALAWYLATYNGYISPILLPSLTASVREFWLVLSSGSYWPDLRVTLTELGAAFSIASVLGCTIGYLVSRSGFTVRVFDPLFAGLYSIPLVLLFPLYVLFFGLGEGSKIAIGATIAFFPIVLNTIAGFDYVDKT